ncbi:MAG: hypothetical protein COB60_12785 [Flavobacteriaceae bacterium]|nr:MAG: hypothetical protein COB60_12785 [Flavobacteriaceae bacterium]
MDDLTKNMLFAIQQKNLVYNYNFLYYSNKKVVDSLITFNHPDGWMYQDSGANGEVSFDDSTKSCLIQKSTDDSTMTFSQVISEFPRWNETVPGKKVSANAVIQNPSSASTNFELTFTIYDGVSKNSKTLFYESGEKKEINVELDVDENATKLEIDIQCSTPKAILYINTIYVNIGEIALDTLPCIVQGVIGERKQYVATENAPAEEFSLCNEVLEITDKFTRLRSVINNRFGVNPDTNNPYLINMSGQFSRAWDNGLGVDPDADDRTSQEKGGVEGDKVGTLEEDVFLKHNHGLKFSLDKPILTGKEGAASIINTSSTSSTEDELDGKETRPVNIAELYTIKWA